MVGSRTEGRLMVKFIFVLLLIILAYTAVAPALLFTPRNEGPVLFSR
jgi:hypothetical protein